MMSDAKKQWLYATFKNNEMFRISTYQMLLPFPTSNTIIFWAQTIHFLCLYICISKWMDQYLPLPLTYNIYSWVGANIWTIQFKIKRNIAYIGLGPINSWEKSIPDPLPTGGRFQHCEPNGDLEFPGWKLYSVCKHLLYV